MFVKLFSTNISFNAKGSGAKKLQEPLDSFSFTIALHTILKQFHENLNDMFIKHLVEYSCHLTKHSMRYDFIHIEKVACLLCFFFSLKNTELPIDSVLAIKFLELYTTFSKSSQDYFSQHMPEEIFHLHQILASNSP